MKTNKIIMIVSDTCATCKVFEKKLQTIVDKHGLKAEFKLLKVSKKDTVSSREAAEFAIEWGLTDLPSVVINSKPFNPGKNLHKFTDEQYLKAMKK